MLKTKMRSQHKPGDLQVDFEQIKKAGFAIRAINHKVRQQMLNLIYRNKEMTVSEIYSKLKLEQSQTSSYLAILRKANAVIARRDGQNVYYSVNTKRISFVEKGSRIVNQEG